MAHFLKKMILAVARKYNLNSSDVRVVVVVGCGM